MLMKVSFLITVRQADRYRQRNLDMTLAWYRVGAGHGLKILDSEIAELEARLGPDRVRKAAHQAETIRQELGLSKANRIMR